MTPFKLGATQPGKIPQNNNMDLLRLIFALTVFFFHIAVLSGVSQYRVFLTYANGLIAVRCFFIISGFLIFMSYENSQNWRSYFEKRVRRIYPAYFAVVIAASVLGIFLTQLSAYNYITHGLFRYLFFNLIFMNFAAPSLPGVFSGNMYNAVNGALWTIKIEVSFYVLVPLLAWIMTRWSRIKVLAALYLLSIIWYATFTYFADKTGHLIFADLAKELPGQLSFFLSGAAVYYYFSYFRVRIFGAALAGAILVLVSMYSNFLVVLPAGLALCVMAAAFGKYLGNAGKFGDFSYGVYVVHFPIIQTFVCFGLVQRDPWLYLIFALIACLCTSFLCWHLVEKPFLRPASHYRVAQSVQGHS